VITVLSPFSPLSSLDRGGLQLRYVDQGQGEPVVMVHGNPTWHYFFRSLIEGLRGSHRVIAPDHIGCGTSDKPDDRRYGYRLKDRIDDLEALLDHAAPQQHVTLVLHDWGGMIGMGWAVRHPERVARLVILNTAAFLMPAGKKLPWQIAVVRNTPLGPLLVRGLNLFSRGLVRYGSVKPLPPEVRHQYLAPYDNRANRRAVLRFVQDIPLRPGDPSYEVARQVQDGLERFRDVPALICWGLRDFVFDEGYLAEWRRRLPGAEVHAFADAGHLVLEDAAERIVPLVRQFLAPSLALAAGKP
jgi:cis-3-alkyl-4-acyloxetan-2-one decarboxylase